MPLPFPQAQTILSSSQRAWPWLRAPDTQGVSGGHVSLERINQVFTLLSLSERLNEVTLLQLVRYKSPFSSTLSEHDGAYPSTAGIYILVSLSTTVHTHHYSLLLYLEQTSYSGWEIQRVLHRSTGSEPCFCCISFVGKEVNNLHINSTSTDGASQSAYKQY